MTKDMVRETTDDFIKRNEIVVTSIGMYFEIYYKFQNGAKPDPNDYKAKKEG
jgi:hypothetical protein